MISQNTIDQVNDLEIHLVVEKYVQLKKSGSQLVGKSPFADEKTGSFMVSPSKGIWKCFSSGIGGNSGISFVMKSQNMDFPEAVKDICDRFNMIVEYDDSDRSKAYQELKFQQTEINNINQIAYDFFFKYDNKEVLKDGRLNKTQIEKWGIGFADNDFKSLYKFLIGKGIPESKIIEAGLVSSGEKGIFDFFNNRIIFPIHDHTKKIIAFGGRNVSEDGPKYINTKETKLFNKSESLFGIHLAKNHIHRLKKANVSEGYYDVIALHENGLENSVAPNGTAFTEDQALLLKKWCDTIRFIFDGDEPGIKAVERSIALVLPLGLKVEVCILPNDLDPDSIQRDPIIQQQIEELDVDDDGTGYEKFIDKHTKDGIEWQVDRYYSKAETIIQKSKAQEKTERLISFIENSRLRNAYTKSIIKKYAISKQEIEKNIKLEIDSRNISDDESTPKLKLPTGANHEDYENFGFCEVKKHESNNTGYWFPEHSGKFVKFEKKSNFVIKPLFHIYSKTDNKRLIEITNKKITRIIDVPSKGFVGMTQFLEAVIDEGNFMFHGSKFNFQQVVMKIMEMFPTCEEIKTLGWQKEGFFAFSNGIAETSFKKIDQNGIVEFNDRKYFLPAFSEVYKNVRAEDDLYENDRFFTFKKSKVEFGEWAKQFCIVHGDNGKIGIAYFITCVFRDFIYNVYKIFPHLFAFGDIATGKSYFARSINSIFHGGQPGFNLSSGTNVGFFRKLAKFRNAIAWFDEYENDIDQKRFQALKAAYDGLGHERGVLSQDNRTETTKINSASLISGQYLPTKDGNALFTRSIVLTFTRKAEDLTTEDIKQGEILKKAEQEGLSSLIVDIIKYRSEIEANYVETSSEVTQELKMHMHEKDEDYNGRILQNFALILTTVKMLESKIKLPFTYEEIKKQSLQMIIKQSSQVNDSDALRTFWKMVEFLLATGQIVVNKDFKIEQLNEVRVKEHKSSEVKQFKQPKKLIFIRFTKIHPLYMEAHRKQMGENGIAETSIKQYMNSHKSFIGLCPGTVFENGKTSAYVFDYDLLGADLEQFKFQNDREDTSEEGEEEEKKEYAF